MKKVIAALVLGMMIGSGTTALAAPNVVQATVAKFKFIVNGKQKSVATEQLVVMGTTYLPVREISNMLDYDVTYKKDANTIELNNGGTNSNSTATSTSNTQNAIEDVKPVDGYVNLNDFAQEYGVSVVTSESDSTITISRGEKKLVFPLPKEDESVMIKGGYSLSRKDSVLYISTFTEKFYLN